jgi:hypothetical protein
MDPQVIHSLQYFLASLAGIARALDDFGYRDEARQIFQIRAGLESKVKVVQVDATDGTGSSK